MFNIGATPFIRDTLQSMRQLQERNRIVAYFPDETECTVAGCGHDANTNSKRDLSCVVCDSRGYITTWTTQIIVARVVHPEPIAFNFADKSVVAETGDVILYIRKQDIDTVNRIKGNERAYFSIDAEDYRPSSVTPIGVTGLDEYRIELNLHTPR